MIRLSKFSRCTPVLSIEREAIGFFGLARFATKANDDEHIVPGLGTILSYAHFLARGRHQGKSKVFTSGVTTRDRPLGDSVSRASDHG